MISKIRVLPALLMVAVAGSAFAAVNAEDAKQLGSSALTLFGAEKGASKDGTIPAYDGNGIKPAKDWDPNQPGRRPDPFNEKPLFSINAQNWKNYADKLTEIQKEMFKKYPDYRMDVYPTHRTMVYPKYVLDNTLKNATSCKTVDDELRLDGCYAGVPFPLPKTGKEVMWNHLLFYGTPSIEQNIRTWHVPPSGSAFLSSASRGVEAFPIYDPKRTTPIESKDIYWRVRLDDYAPARSNGQKLMLIDAIDQVGIGRRAYQYLPGQRRVKLAPDLAYDTPQPTNGGVGTVDDAKLFLGAMDRFDFKLVGKAEKFVAYNTFGATDYKTCPEEKLTSTKHFPNPDCIRWELHRVWVVDSTVKPKFRHIYHRRTFYFDEDSYGAGVQEAYDASGKLYRGAYNTFYTYWEKDGGNDGSVVNIDLVTGDYVMQGTAAAPGAGFWPGKSKPDVYFSPEALAGEGIK
ncbi:DUF1329 domain-containing protein [Burkholderia sp. Ac-20353]|uniref:DUF1329 domain-containing protein n=1 Tax=Burkholderia sp. Ac-20353 TaxID=2703894 RepID=UPI00197B329F|nr:DUF1329 domain-containing protein [Burkholderia sp. Ac-20353]MBN3788513.1 DUF1329 domain-containing protein [Burkholderia sp. Ac-20353]